MTVKVFYGRDNVNATFSGTRPTVTERRDTHETRVYQSGSHDTKDQGG